MSNVKSVHRMVKNKDDLIETLKERGFTFQETVGWYNVNTGESFTHEMFEFCGRHLNLFPQKDSEYDYIASGFNVNNCYGFKEDWLIYVDEETKKESYMSNPYHCPHCYSENISSYPAVPIEIIPAEYKVIVHCDDCGSEWTEYYKLYDVEFEEE